MVKKGAHRGRGRETARYSVKDGGAVGADTSTRATAQQRQPPHGVETRQRQSPWLTPRRSPSRIARQSPSAIALFLSKKGKHVRREAAGLSCARRVSNATRCNRLGRVVLTLGELKRITKDFSDDQLIGEGGLGKVYKGVLTNGDVIAVKRFASTITGLQDVQYENEAQHLMRLKHPNIVQLVGYCSETEMKLVSYNGKIVLAERPERLLCLEYVPKGSLHGHLSDETSGLEWKTRYQIIEGICYGLHYLHEDWQATPIIHMDLKPANILLDDNMVPKIADFGLSRLFGEEQTRTCTRICKGTLGYMPPEYLEKGVITKKFDIFSLGVIIIEIITGVKDYPTDETKTASQQYIDLVLNNWRHRLIKAQGNTSEDIDYQQIKKCIHIGLLCVKNDRVKRPTIKQIIEMLERSDEACQLVRLAQIKRDGAYHQRLQAALIHNVEDFLKALNENPNKLRAILKMENQQKLWSKLTEHARECVPEDRQELKRYHSKEGNVVIFFNCVHELVGAAFPNEYVPCQRFNSAEKAYVKKWIRHAYDVLDSISPNFVMRGHVPEPISTSSSTDVAAAPSVVAAGASQQVFSANQLAPYQHSDITF